MQNFADISWSLYPAELTNWSEAEEADPEFQVGQITGPTSSDFDPRSYDPVEKTPDHYSYDPAPTASGTPRTVFPDYTAPSAGAAYMPRAPTMYSDYPQDTQAQTTEFAPAIMSEFLYDYETSPQQQPRPTPESLSDIDRHQYTLSRATGSRYIPIPIRPAPTPRLHPMRYRPGRRAEQSLPKRTLVSEPWRSKAFTEEAATRLAYLTLGPRLTLNASTWQLTVKNGTCCFVKHGRLFPPGLHKLFKYLRPAIDASFTDKYYEGVREPKHPGLTLKRYPTKHRLRSLLGVEEIANRMQDRMEADPHARSIFESTTLNEFPLPVEDPRALCFAETLQGCEISILDLVSGFQELDVM